MDDALSKNLSFLCSHYPSIAEACRKLGFNRQQFNKYLAGASRPSRHNMRRICDFFGVTESEILLEPARFEGLVAVRRRPLLDERIGRPLQHLDTLYRHSQSLERYVGYYFRYFYSFGHAGKIIKSLCSIHGEDGKYFWKNVERIRSPDGQHRTTINKYIGAAFLLADRIFIVEYESLLCNSVTQVTLYPCYRSHVGQLLGIQTGGPIRRGRKPGASKVLLEYLGRDVDVRNALRQTGLYADDDPRLARDTVAMVTNTMSPGSYVLEVDEP